MEDERLYDVCVNGELEELNVLLEKNPTNANRMLFASGGSYHLGVTDRRFGSTFWLNK